jgi:uncharacterized protein YqgC (DUF456 family)
VTVGRSSYAAAVTEILLIVVVAIVMIVGIAGTVLPLVPGIWLIWVAALAYGLFDGFGPVGWVAMVAISLTGAVGTAVGVVAPQRKATAIGVPLWGQVLSAGLAVLGVFAIPVVGAVLGFLLGVAVSAIVTTGSLREAIPAAWMIVRSMLLASGLQLVAAMAMFLMWIAWVLLG